jgi:hypothetical protein
MRLQTRLAATTEIAKEVEQMKLPAEHSGQSAWYHNLALDAVLKLLEEKK